MSEILQIKPRQKIRVFCPICIWNRNKSKKFSTTYALKYHLSSEHEGEIYSEDLNLENIQNVLRAFEKAVEIGMVRNT